MMNSMPHLVFKILTLISDAWPYIAQALSIAGKIVLINVLALRFRKMRYSFYFILIRKLFHRDSEPFDWLRNNIIFVIYLISIVTQIILLLGLLQQFANHQLGQKLIEFQIAGGLGSITLCYIFIHLFENEDGGLNRFRTYIKIFKHKN